MAHPVLVLELPSNAIKAEYKGYEYYATPEGQIFTYHEATGYFVKKHQIKQAQTKIYNGVKKCYAYGHSFISLYRNEGKNPKQTTVTVSKLIAHALIPNPQNLPFALHKDETLTNGLLSNHVSNLFWGDAKSNSADAKSKGRMKNNGQGPRLQNKTQQCPCCLNMFRPSNIGRHEVACAAGKVPYKPKNKTKPKGTKKGPKK